MLKKILSGVVILFVSLNYCLKAQDMLSKYKRAESLMAGNVNKLLYNENFYPHFIGESHNFWYKYESENGYEYYLVIPEKGKNEPAFNHKKLAEQIFAKSGNEVKPFQLDLENLEFSSELDEITFNYDNKKWKYSTRKKELISIQEEKNLKNSVESPNKKWLAFIKDFNVWVLNIESKDSFQLSLDGTEKTPYGLTYSWYFTKNESTNVPDEYETVMYWSPDSKKIIIPQYDRKQAKKLYLYNTSPEKGFRSEINSYVRPLAGDSLLTTVSYSLFNIKEKSQIKLNISPNATFLNNDIEWLPSSLKAYLLKYKRGYQSRKLIEIDARTGEVNMLFNEQSKTYTDPLNHNFLLLEEVGMFLWSSEITGWNHIYLHDLKTGSMIKEVTTGEFAVHKVICVDQQKSLIYFTAFGKEAGDPYYNYLYLTDFKGNFIRKITPEEAYHVIYKSPDKKLIVDVFSNYHTPEKVVAYKVSNGEKIMDICQASSDLILEKGVKYPEPFSVLARDNKTSIYGIIYRPSDFDSTKRYPIIDATYSGPQTIRTPKTFRRVFENNELAIAELGFIVVTVDGLGTAFRSKAFHDFSYKNLGDIGCEDHVKAIKELARKYPYMDTSRVGIYGHSAGGYDAVRALILRPDFYKVAVSSAGNHDHRIAKAWWPELYMGYPVGKHYDEQSNILNASKIKGKLLLAHGNMDNNVNPSGTLRLADELVKANKDFELIITPGDDHGALYYNPYFIRRRWDFFVKNLLGKEPPLEYKINHESVK